MKTYRNLLLTGLLHAVPALLPASPALCAEEAAGNAPAVFVREEPDTAVIGNGIIAATVRKSDGRLVSLKRRGVEMISRGGGYWNIYGKIPGQKSTERKGTPSVFRISRNPDENGGDQGELSLRFPYTGQAGAVPLDIEIRYTLHRGDSGLYAWTIAGHDAGYPPFNIEASTVCLKLNPDVFDFLSIDETRQRRMASPEDWVRGGKLNLREARRMHTGIRKGMVEHKYDYSMLYSKTPAWGWSSSTRNIGLFIVNPSIEYVNGSAVQIDYGGHLDGKASLPADPTLLFIWHSPHYGGRNIQIGEHDQWRKIVGPFLIYSNQGESPKAMWRDALNRAGAERDAWPYDWVRAPGYAHAADRGSVAGRLRVRDPQAPAAHAAGAWVGLSHAPYQARFGDKDPITIDWQTDGKHYQYWTRADTEGRFSIPHARPGNYTLTAFADGILGVFSRADVLVTERETNELGELVWSPVRHGLQRWEIGVPDRSAAEFRHGDHYWQWGLYKLYPDEFPDDVDFVIGKSDWRRDWNYAQPPRPDPEHPADSDGNGGRWLDTTWRIRFDMERDAGGTATLRLAICGARGGPVDVAVNGTAVGSTGPLPESGVMHRDGIRSDSLTERNIRFDSSLLKAGENTIELTKRVRGWTDGVLYDYLRLEIDETKELME